MARNIQHVIWHMEGGWALMKGGTARITRRFKTQQEAITYGRTISRKQGAVFVIHRRDGTVKSMEHYEKNPHSHSEPK